MAFHFHARIKTQAHSDREVNKEKFTSSPPPVHRSPPPRSVHAITAGTRFPSQRSLAVHISAGPEVLEEKKRIFTYCLFILYTAMQIKNPITYKERT